MKFRLRHIIARSTFHKKKAANMPGLAANNGNNVLTVYGYVPAWGLPDISPYVTKVVFFLKLTNTPFKYDQLTLPELDKNAPCGKLPFIVDVDGMKVHDSNRIIEYLGERYGITLDKDLSASERAVAVAFERLFGEHLYWSGIIEPRWRRDEGWEVYIPYIVSTPPHLIQVHTDDSSRSREQK